MGISIDAGEESKNIVAGNIQLSDYEVLRDETFEEPVSIRYGHFGMVTGCRFKQGVTIVGPPDTARAVVFQPSLWKRIKGFFCRGRLIEWRRRTAGGDRVFSHNIIEGSQAPKLDVRGKAFHILDNRII